jgi:hypothetical protein
VFSTWCNDAGKDAGAIEAHLDHDLGGKVKTSYDRGDRLALRVELVAWYEDQLHSARQGAAIVPLQHGARAA